MTKKVKDEDFAGDNELGGKCFAILVYLSNNNCICQCL